MYTYETQHVEASSKIVWNLVSFFESLELGSSPKRSA